MELTPLNAALASAPSRGNLHFHFAGGFATQRLAGVLHSLVRVSRRDGWSHVLPTARRSCALPPQSKAHASQHCTQSWVTRPDVREGGQPREACIIQIKSDRHLSRRCPSQRGYTFLSPPRRRESTSPTARGHRPLPLARAPQECRCAVTPQLQGAI